MRLPYLTLITCRPILEYSAGDRGPGHKCESLTWQLMNQDLVSVKLKQRTEPHGFQMIEQAKESLPKNCYWCKAQM